MVDEIAGLDFSFHKPDPAAVAKAGYRFVLGYASLDPHKNLTNLGDYLGAGLLVGIIWETVPGRALQGAAAGQEDAVAADKQLDAIGYPTDAVLFFAVDVDTTTGQLAAIHDYAVAFDRWTKRPVGVYGEFDVVEALVTPGQRPVGYGWQCAAWSGPKLSQKANIYQRIGHPNWPLPEGTGPGDTDEDVLIHAIPLAAPRQGPPPAPAEPPPGVQGEIEVKYRTTPGLTDLLGAPVTPEKTCPDGVGRFNHFANDDGSIYWTPDTGAFAVHGDIARLWASQGWETGPLGYPVSDEFGVSGYDRAGQPVYWRQSNFQHGCITWTQDHGAVARVR